MSNRQDKKDDCVEPVIRWRLLNLPMAPLDNRSPIRSLPASDSTSLKESKWIFRNFSAKRCNNKIPWVVWNVTKNRGWSCTQKILDYEMRPQAQDFMSSWHESLFSSPGEQCGEIFTFFLNAMLSSLQKTVFGDWTRVLSKSRAALQKRRQ